MLILDINKNKMKNLLNCKFTFLPQITFNLFLCYFCCFMFYLLCLWWIFCFYIMFSWNYVNIL